MGTSIIQRLSNCFNEIHKVNMLVVDTAYSSTFCHS
uniref:Uncharacterized protein n=1 Tax=Rhizophora mucronata TaxID=61149 RepID=A0A2P2NMZ8_RHIMU